MPLNQKQRDHAIAMISARIKEKKKTIEIPYQNPNNFAQEWLYKNNRKSISVATLFPSDSYNSTSRSWDGYIYEPRLEAIIPFDLFPKLKDAWKKYCENHAKENKNRTADLVKLEEDLIGEIMFGTSYSVVEVAFKKIESL